MTVEEAQAIVLKFVVDPSSVPLALRTEALEIIRARDEAAATAMADAFMRLTGRGK